MKRIALALFAVTLVAVSAGAQNMKSKANVPFAFTVGNTTMPAGAYVISSTAGDPFATSLVGPNRITSRLAGSPSGVRADAPTLVFHRYGNQYFLSEFRNEMGSRALAVSRTERELNKTATAPRGETIFLAMR